MKKVIKWCAGIIGILAVLILGAVVVVPIVVDVKQYKSQIESFIGDQTGRTFTMGEDIDLSVFPWIGIKLNDVVLGNAPGFKTQDMVSVKSFEVRLKVMPLLSRQVQVAALVLDTPSIALEKNRAGKGNWEDIGPRGEKAAPAAPASAAPATAPGVKSGDLPIASLMVGRCAIVNGTLYYSDAGSGLSKTVSDLNLELTDISLDKPVKLALRALIDGQPLSLDGTAGPLGRNPAASDINLDLTLKAADTAQLSIRGSLIQSSGTPELSADVGLAPFSPRQLLDRLGMALPVQTRDAKVLDKVSLKTAVKASAKALALTGGEMVLDDSTLTFSAAVKAFRKPDVRFDLNLDKIDLDRYLPPKSGDDGASGTAAGSDAASGAAPGKTPAPQIDYAPLRTLVLDGNAVIGELRAANLTLSHIKAHVTGKGGILTLDPLSVDLYEGSSQVKSVVDVRGKTPSTTVSLTTKGVQAGPLVRDGAGKDIIEGTLAADVNLSMTGDTPERIRETLGGKGDLTFTDGAIMGIDIAGTIRNAASGLGLTENASEKPKTDFAEFKLPYTAEKGLITIPGASLVSPLLRLAATGTTHLVREDLDFKIEPKLVATIKGQGDTQTRSGLLIPLNVTGTWSDPKIRPDMAGMLKQQVSDPGAIKSLIEGKGASGEKTSVEDTAKGLIKGLFN